MTDDFIELLRSWQNFYFMNGGASATLIGLMFVALSLGTHLVSDSTRENMKTFVTPSVYYFVSVLLLAGIMLVPAYTPMGIGVMLFVGGIFGLVITVQHVRRLIQAALQYGDFDRADWLAQIILPIVSYGLILAAAILFAVNQWSLAFIASWSASILLLICAITNTWSLVMWIVEQRRE
jgi:hypothetical protein